MAGIKISGLPPVPTAAALTDVFAAVQGGTTYKESLQQVYDLFSTTGTATSVIADDTTTNATMYPVWVTAATGALPLKVSSTKFTFNPSTGVIGTATWGGAVVAETFGGTNQSSYTLGDILFSDATNSLDKLAGNTTTTKLYLSQTGDGALSAAPVWSTITGAAGVTISNDVATNATMYPTWVTANTGDLPLKVSDTVFNFNPSTAYIGGTAKWGATPVELAYGGTNANLTANNGGIFYSTATAGAILNGTATANQVLFSGATAAPTWSPYTLPATAGIAGKILRSNATNYVDSSTTYPDAAILGDMIYGSGANTQAQLAGNTTTTKMYLSQTGDGANSAAPAWSTITGAAGIAVTDDTTEAGTVYPVYVKATSGDLPTFVASTKLAFVPNTGVISLATWQGAVIAGTYGGTGVNNGSSTITIGGSVTFSGGFTFGATITANTSVTFPVSGTLLSTDVAQEYTATKNFNMTTLTSTSNSIAWDLAANQVARHVATENTTLANPTNKVAGATYIFIFVQDSTPRTLSFDTDYLFPGGVAPTVSTGSGDIDLISFVCDGTNMLGTFAQDFS